MPLTTETLPNGLTLFQDDRFFKLGQDSVLLSAFAKIRRRAKVLDLGCGTGALALLCWREDLTVTGLEIQQDALDLFRRSIEENGLALKAVRKSLVDLGYVHNNPIMSVGTLGLPVSPALKLTDRGLVDVKKGKIVPLIVSEKRNK